MKKVLFRGCGTAIATPFTEDNINLTEFAKLVEYQINEGIDAIIVCGTTGESSTMTLEEKKTLIKFSVELIDRRGIESIIKISSIISRYDGKLALCEISDRIKENFKNSDIYDYCFRTKNELTSLGVFKI